MNSPKEVKEKLLKAEAHTPQAFSGGGQATSNGHLSGQEEHRATMGDEDTLLQNKVPY